MKILNHLFIVIIFTILLITCSSKTNKIEAGETKQDMKVETQKPQYVISVTQKDKPMGDIVVELFPDVAPLMCRNFDSLVSIGFYDGTAFHRVMPGFMIQGGDPNSKNKPKETWGQGDPSQTNIRAEFSDISHMRGILSTARSKDINSGSSQFFIMVGDAPRLDHQYTVFGHVISGIGVVDDIVNSPTGERNCPIDKIEMKIKKK